MTQIVVFVPGILGSELVYRNKIIWPGSPYEYCFSYCHMEELLSPETRVGGIIRSYGVLKQYQSLITDLNKFGFQLEGPPPSLYLFPYDWRQSNFLSAEQLAEKLASVVAEHSGEFEIILIAHSMGGLICRLFLESGKYHTHAAWSKVTQLITIGTPHRGAPKALTMILGQDSQLFLAPDQVRELAGQTAFPSAYELLPPPGEPFIWDKTNRGTLAPLDLYSDEIRDRLQLNGESLQSAKKMHEVLSAVAKPPQVSYFCFSGSRLTTVTHVRANWNSEHRPITKYEAVQSGDGTVPYWSSFLPRIQHQPSSGEHGTLYTANEVRYVLAEIMNCDGLLGAEDQTIKVIVRDKVIPISQSRQTFIVGINCEPPLLALHGNLVICEVDATADVSTPGSRTSSVEIDYHGGSVEWLELRLDVPSKAGVYRIEFIPHDPQVPRTPDGEDHFVVQG